MTDAPHPVDPENPAFVRAQAPIKLLFFDFDGVFTDNHVFVFEDGREAVRCSRFDGIGLRRLERAGVEACIVSTEVNPVVGARAQKLKIASRQGLEDKVAAANELAAERGLALSACGFVGNDVNDIPLLRQVGLPLGVADAHEDIWPYVRWLTRRPGGSGAVREICDAFGAARGVEARYP
jgi:YrbI family 3-deoxy-D-manno-octulosonate 8-phosphate phosphatase